MVNRHVSGAHYGLRDWLAQRITAVVMILYTVLFVVMLLKMPQFDYAGWRSVWMAPLMRYATLLFLLCLFVHAWVGMRNIFMDYIKPTGLRVALYAAVILALVAYGAWAVQILWGR
jgi:succinate dehydrogenase / fumarate reductase membrane anchor subunit